MDKSVVFDANDAFLCFTMSDASHGLTKHFRRMSSITGATIVTSGLKDGIPQNTLTLIYNDSMKKETFINIVDMKSIETELTLFPEKPNTLSPEEKEKLR